MGQGYGREVPQPHRQGSYREVTKYLVIIQGVDGPIARLLLSNRDQVAELDGNTEEVASMIKGVTPIIGATGAEWDKALSGHSARERAAAEVYMVDP